MTHPGKRRPGMRTTPKLLSSLNTSSGFDSTTSPQVEPPNGQAQRTGPPRQQGIKRKPRRRAGSAAAGVRRDHLSSADTDSYPQGKAAPPDPDGFRAGRR